MCGSVWPVGINTHTVLILSPSEGSVKVTDACVHYTFVFLITEK
jgi:hypothetical protein